MLRTYQSRARNKAIESLVINDNPGIGFLFDPGLGKTLTTLDTLDYLRSLGMMRRALIVAPLRVIYNVWQQEIARWGYHFSSAIVHGTPKQRLAALAEPVDIHLINADGVRWLRRLKHRPQYDVLGVDESTLFKNATAKRTRALVKLASEIPKRIILSGTPFPNSEEDMYSQSVVLDGGRTFGLTLTEFRKQFMFRDGGRFERWELRDDRKAEFEKRLSKIAIRLDARDHLSLPDLIENDVVVSLPPATLKAYKKLERELFLETKTATVLAMNEGSKYHLCRGVANGGAYENRDDGSRIVHHVHDAKTEATKQIVHELGGRPVLIAYTYNHDLERLREAFPGAPAIRGGQNQKESQAIVEQWNRKELPALLCQPEAMSHGLNMQAGGNDAIWYGLSNRLETYLQFNKRLHRQGVEGSVRIHHIIAEHTVDVAVMARLRSRNGRQSAMLDALRKYFDDESYA